MLHKVPVGINICQLDIYQNSVYYLFYITYPWEICSFVIDCTVSLVDEPWPLPSSCVVQFDWRVFVALAAREMLQEIEEKTYMRMEDFLLQNKHQIVRNFIVHVKWM